MNTAEQEIVETELERVERWRTAELLRVGFAGDDAVALAARMDVDLHEAVELVSAAARPSLRSASWVDLTVARRRGHNACP